MDNLKVLCSNDKKDALRLIPLKKSDHIFWDAHTLLYIFHKTWHLYCCRVYTPVNVNLNNSFFFTGFFVVYA